ncbi:unnamed protein product [Knipowitschia caucasica]|uniref:Immunoglobulin domain-containing protein n=2 Tax=Knipowitschia caucasica TaxID=637954 RepID=A0AAV2KPL8_KNICA
MDLRLYTVSVMLLVLSGRSRAAKTLEVREGEDLRFKFSFYKQSNSVVFCKDRCDQQGTYLLWAFPNLKMEEGRYSIEYKKRSFPPSLVYVTIKNVRSSDAGLYSCLMERYSFRATESEIQEVNIYVISDASHKVSEDQSTPEPDHLPQSDVWLYVGLVLSFLVLLSLIVTALHQRRGATDTGDRSQMVPDTS